MLICSNNHKLYYEIIEAVYDHGSNAYMTTIKKKVGNNNLSLTDITHNTIVIMYKTRKKNERSLMVQTKDKLFEIDYYKMMKYRFNAVTLFFNGGDDFFECRHVNISDDKHTLKYDLYGYSKMDLLKNTPLMEIMDLMVKDFYQKLIREKFI